MINIKQLPSERKTEIKTTILIFILLLPHFQPSGINLNGSFIDTCFNIARVLSACFVGILYLSDCIKNKNISKLFLVFGLAQLFIFINTIVQVGFYKDVLMKVVSSFAFYMTIDFYIRKNPKELLHSLLILFELSIYINFIFMIIYPNGISSSNIHLLGNRCLLFTYFVTALVLALIWKSYSGKSIRFYILFAVCIVSNIIGKSVTGLFSFLLFLFLYVTKLYKYKHTTIITGIIGYFILFFSVVIFRFQNYFGSILGMLGKNITFSGRTILWDNSIEYILQKPLFGYGFLSGELRIPLIGYGHCHNYLLEQLFQGGLFQLMFTVVFLIIVIKQMKNVKNNLQTKYIVLGILPLCMHLIAESGQNLICYILFFLAAYSEQLCNALPIKEKEEQEESKLLK